MSISGRDDPLDGLPARRHFVWLLDRVGGAAGGIDPNEFESHAMPADFGEAHRPSGVSWHEYIAGDLCTHRQVSPVSAVTSWRTDRAGGLVVTYTGTDGRDYDLTAQVDLGTGRLIGPAAARSTGDIDVVYLRPAQLSPAESARLSDVITACYDELDEAWLERRLRSISDLVVAWRGDEILGFSGCGRFDADLPNQRSCRITFGGLWIRPDARGLQLARALSTRAAASNLLGEFDFTLLSFASEITFQMQFPGPFFWPGTTLETALHALSTASGLIRNLTAQAAIAAGSTGFDGKHWVAHGLEHGTPNVTPRDINPAIKNLFRHVQQPNGDTLTIPACLGPPPAFLRT